MSDTPVVDDAPDRVRTERLAAGVFAVAMLVAFVTFMAIGRRNWFFLDEWDFLALRSLSSTDDLLQPHNEHWSTLPIIAYRGMWKVFGLRTYLPYLALVVALHVTAAALLRVVMRRAGVHPWLATAGAGMFLFLGAGYENILWAFQIGFVGSLVCGLAHLVLSDHDGGFDHRDALGLAFGLAGLMCSGVSVTMVGVVGLAVLVRRGWRLALLHTVPLAVVFGTWYAAYGSDSYDAERPSAGTLVDFVWTALSNALRATADLDAIAGLLFAVLVIGGGLAFVDRRRLGSPRSIGPWALLAGAIAFATITGLGRAGVLGTAAATPSRYVHLLGAMVLPAVAVGAQAIASRWRFALPVLALALVAGIPGNLAEVRTADTVNERVFAGNPAVVKALPVVDLARVVPGRTQPDRNGMKGVTIAWLLGGHRSGRIPDPDRDDRRARGVARTRLAVEQVAADEAPTNCRPIDPTERIELARSERIRIDGGDATVQLLTPEPKGPHVIYSRLARSGLVARVDGVSVRIRPLDGAPIRLCR